MLSRIRAKIVKNLPSITNDPAMFIHQFTMLKYLDAYNIAIHASGKFVPYLIKNYQGESKEAMLKLLNSIQSLLSKPKDIHSESIKNSIINQIQKLYLSIKSPQ